MVIVIVQPARKMLPKATLKGLQMTVPVVPFRL
jgi:hypothetical protein